MTNTIPVLVHIPEVYYGKMICDHATTIDLKTAPRLVRAACKEHENMGRPSYSVVIRQDNLSKHDE